MHPHNLRRDHRPSHYMVTLDESMEAIYKTLNADATLRGASYLDGSNKIIKGPTKPDKLPNPSLTMRPRHISSPSEQDLIDRFLIQLVLHVDNHIDLSADYKRAGLVERRIAELIDRKSLNGASGRYHIATYRARFGSIGLPIDSESVHEHMFIFPYETVIA